MMAFSLEERNNPGARMAEGAAKRCWKEKKLPWKEKTGCERGCSHSQFLVFRQFSITFLFPP
jgi:hypothetical protein